ncbi:MAG TPA: type IV pilin protein [Oxalicibacterium sp.]|jgi:type IV pilus assembly protein PilE|nr:type IV pilin protein [Oxalicibacterium sp.]
MRTTRRQHGFTLIEAMIVLLIVAILAAIAYPSYRESVLKTRRTEGKAALMKLMQQQERYYTLHASYLAFSAGSSDEEAKRFKWFSGDSPAASFYEIEAGACEGEDLRACVMLNAWPGSARVNASYRDPLCGRLSLNSRGERSADAASCWP